MLQYLVHLPYEAFGEFMLGFLDLIDIVQLEKAAANHEAQKLLKGILPYCPDVVIPDRSFNQLQLKPGFINWFHKRRCCVQFVKIAIEVLLEVDFENSMLNNIELCFDEKIVPKIIKPLQNPCINQRIRCVEIKGDQYFEVMEVLFLLLSCGGSVRCLTIQESNLSQWIEYLQNIAHDLKELVIEDKSADIRMYLTILQNCSDLEILSLSYMPQMKASNILVSIARNCPYLYTLSIKELTYRSESEAEADLTAFAEECPQLEELSLNCKQFTNQSVITLAQHCSNLCKLKLSGFSIGAASLIALSERGLPLEELDIPRIPIRSAEIAAQCAHALSQIRKLRTCKLDCRKDRSPCVLQYMTGLRELRLDSAEDHLLVPHLLLLCAGLESLYIHSTSSVTPQQLSEILPECANLHTLDVRKPACISTAVLPVVALPPHLQKVTLHNTELMEEDVLTLAVHCRQLQVLNVNNIAVAEETMGKIVLYCRRLTELHIRVTVREREALVERSRHYSSKEIRALREKAQRTLALR